MLDEFGCSDRLVLGLNHFKFNHYADVLVAAIFQQNDTTGE